MTTTAAVLPPLHYVTLGLGSISSGRDKSPWRDDRLMPLPLLAVRTHLAVLKGEAGNDLKCPYGHAGWGGGETLV